MLCRPLVELVDRSDATPWCRRDVEDRMKPWFEDLPLDFTRDETRAAERLLIAGYPLNVAALTLAQNAGLDLTALNQMAPVNFLMRDILTKARLSNRLVGLIGEVLGDPARAAIHEQLRALVAGHEATFVDAAMRRKPSRARVRPRRDPRTAVSTRRSCGVAPRRGGVRTARIDVGGRAPPARECGRDADGARARRAGRPGSMDRRRGPDRLDAPGADSARGRS